MAIHKTPALIGLLALLLFGFGSLESACTWPSNPTPMNVAMTVERHDQDFFPATHGEEENPDADCNICHGGFDSFQEYTCFGCHAHEQDITDSEHEDIEDYLYESQSCLNCHPDGSGEE